MPSTKLRFFSVPPKSGPRISGIEDYYRVGDLVEINCTSVESKPAAHISWTVNGIKVDSRSVKLREHSSLYEFQPNLFD
jgi:hypothetical protein